MKKLIGRLSITQRYGYWLKDFCDWVGGSALRDPQGRPYRGLSIGWWLQQLLNIVEIAAVVVAILLLIPIAFVEMIYRSIVKEETRRASRSS